MPGGSEILGTLLGKLKQHKFQYSGYKEQLSTLLELLKEDYQITYEIRASKKLSLKQNKSIREFASYLKEHPSTCTIKYQELKEEEEDILRQKTMAETKGSQDHSEEDS